MVRDFWDTLYIDVSLFNEQKSLKNVPRVIVAIN